jgi:hypothetical protein
MSTEICDNAPHSKRICYRLAEFAELTGIPYRTVLNQCQCGKIPSTFLGSIRVIPATYVELTVNHAA